MSNLKKLIVVSMILTAFGVMSACSTVKGFGRDVSQTGKDIQRVAR